MIFYIPVIASTILLLLYWRDLGLRSLFVLGAAWLVATYCQFFGRSLLIWVVGLLLHVGVAIWLSVRRKLEA